MTLPLSITDPLSNHDVTIMITLNASDTSLAERPLLLSVGMAEQLPVVKTGVFTNLMSLIEEAWTALGVRKQVEGSAIEEETIAEEETSISDTVATADTDNHETQPPSPNPRSATQPQAKNLSLF